MSQEFPVKRFLVVSGRAVLARVSDEDVLGRVSGRNMLIGGVPDNKVLDKVLGRSVFGRKSLKKSSLVESKAERSSIDKLPGKSSLVPISP